MRCHRFIAPLLLGLALPLTGAPPAGAQVAMTVSVTLPPPALPVYAQPALPGPGYLWTPGYWSWGAQGYFWVPGTWVMPPAVGLLWTPGYWAWTNGAYFWHAGYWGPHVGFYGGIDYGFGYSGVGYAGGRWDNGHFSYNRAVNNFGRVHVTNVYNQTVVVNRTSTHVSFNGGNGGTTARPSATEESAGRETHRPATAPQANHARVASTTPAMRADMNHGKPAIAATQRPGQFTHVQSRPQQNVAHAPARGVPEPQHGPAPAPAHAPMAPKAATPAPGHEAGAPAEQRDDQRGGREDDRH